jgi:hypothetical protein
MTYRRILLCCLSFILAFAAVILILWSPVSAPPISTPERVRNEARPGQTVRIVTRLPMSRATDSWDGGRGYVWEYRSGIPPHAFPVVISARFNSPVKEVPAKSVVCGKVWRVSDGVVTLIDCRIEEDVRP